MRDKQTQLAQEIAALTRAILGFTVRVIWFGSWPQGTARARSDLDIAVSAGDSIPLAAMARLRDAIENLPTLCEIDLVDLQSVGLSLKDEILRHWVEL